MTDLLLCIEGILSGGWDLLKSINIPGTEITFAMLFVGLAFISGGFTLLSLALGVSLGIPNSSWFGSGSHDGSYSARGSRRFKISAERRNDER